ncbi:Prolipoprotein diacylglyceryl transferase [Fulvivirga imtechensis AK7]|uniref:Prolipoprotein diacylglyceryl transferase n=1 Tax=Fulvivirga imtechensis AK7 TaxID=1237149 RepID=L8JM71_9BACT|nr:prolipoprotein diacylglyceryl transferase family protein [Fulvivirga imtechensis]ELR69308.1 Prolipoprotein diacylglyceryl transferase [Fulvivirga imtechensis AK7]
MHPILFEIPLPDFLKNWFGEYLTIYSYGFFIVIGAILSVTYVAWQTKKKFDLSFDAVNTLFLLLLLAAIIGGKALLFFERPAFYLKNFGDLLSGRGFVFYGSLLFTIPTMLWFFKKHRLPTRPMLDIMAITTCIVHFFGRLGCFMAGCCHGIEWHGPLAVVFSDSACLAPLNTPLHPTQLYSALMILSILIGLHFLKSKKKFEGQLFLTYLMVYAIGRSVIEVFRGDVSRGFVVEGYLSHSQFISLLIFVIAAFFYYEYLKKSSLGNVKQPL